MSLQFARDDYAAIIGAGEFSVQCTFTSLGTPAKTAIISGLYAEHHTSISTDGMPVNSKTTRLTIVEKNLTDLTYTVRNSDNRVNLNNHKVAIADIKGTVRNYVIKESLPDNGLGGITLILADYKAS